MDPYNLCFKNSTKYYTSSHPDEIMEAFMGYKPNKILKNDEQKYKVKFTVRTIDSENQITMKILEVNPETRCIEFVNQKGHLLDFHSHIYDYTLKEHGLLYDFINVVYDEN